MARPLAVDFIAVIRKMVNTTLNTTIKAKILKQRRHGADCGRRAVGSRKRKIREPNFTIAATGNVSTKKDDPRREIAAVKQAHHQVMVAMYLVRINRHLLSLFFILEEGYRRPEKRFPVTKEHPFKGVHNNYHLFN